MKNSKRVSAWMFATVLAASVSAAVKGAGPLDDKVPSDSIVYVGWAGADALAPQYAGSNLKGIVEASEAKNFISQQLPKLINMAGQQDPQAPQIIAKLQMGLGMAWQHPGAFYFCPIDFSNPQVPGIRLGLVCDAGGDAKAMSDLLTEALSKAPPPGPNEPQVKVSVEGSLVCLTVGKADSAADRAKGGGLAASPDYVKAMSHVKLAKPAMAAYFDIAKGMAVLSDGISKAPGIPTEARTQMPTMIDALGINGLTQMVSVGGFDGKEWSEQAFLGVNGPRRGILALMGATPLSDGVLAEVPKEAVSFAALKLDPQAIYNEVRTVVGKIDANAVKQMDQGIAQGNAQLGVDIEKDIIAPFGDEWVFYRAPLSDIGGLSFALVHKARDGERLAATVAKGEAMANAMGQGRFKIDKITSGKIEFSSISFLQYSVAWTVRNGYLYVSSVDGLPGAVKQVENKLPSIADSELYKKAIAGLPQGVKPVSMGYSNPAKVYPELRRLALGMLPLARAAGVDIPAGILPDIDDVGQFMTPGANMSWWDADGLHVAGKSAFPGAELFGGSPGGGPAIVAVAGLGAGVLMPSLGKSRELANRSVDAANLRGLAQSCVIYAADNQDKLPDDFGRLIVNGQISPRQLVNKWSGTEPLAFTPEMEQLAKTDYAKFAAVVAEHCDYVYLGKGMKGDFDANIVIAYDKPAPYLTDGMNMTFADAHAEFIRWNGVAAQFGPTNDLLKKLNLPTVDVADVMQKAGRPTMQMAPRATGGLP